MIALLPLYAMCDRWDIGGLSTPWHWQTDTPSIFVYDGYPGGIGLSRRGYDAFESLAAAARTLVAECPCESGCPSCVQSPKCGNLNEPLSKAGAVALLGAAGGQTPAHVPGNVIVKYEPGVTAAAVRTDARQEGARGRAADRRARVQGRPLRRHPLRYADHRRTDRRVRGAIRA